MTLSNEFESLAAITTHSVGRCVKTARCLLLKRLGFHMFQDFFGGINLSQSTDIIIIIWFLV